MLLNRMRSEKHCGEKADRERTWWYDIILRLAPDTPPESAEVLESLTES